LAAGVDAMGSHARPRLGIPPPGSSWSFPMNTQPSIQYVPLNSLLTSQLNVRRTDRKADIEALAASIASHGLLQNLTVTPASMEKFQVVAGGRRLAALKSLAKAGSIARDFAVPCQVIEPGSASEASLVENVHRVAMNVMDEVDAFSALTDGGSSIDDIARRFGCTQRHVEQRLALATLSPKLKAAYRRSDLTLDAARAFCIEPDRSKQEAVFKFLNKPVSNAASVRARLTEGRMKASDRIAKFVGIEAYEAAGGRLTHDLFDDRAVFVNDPALMTHLADERLEIMRADFLSAGWGWVNVNLGNGRFGGGARRIYPSRRPTSESETKTLEEMDAVLAEYEEMLEDAEDDDSRWADRDALDERRQAFFDSFQDWDLELIRHAGIVISIDYEGRPNFAYGVVTKIDEPALKKLLAAREKVPAGGEATDNDPGTAPSDQAPADEIGPRLPKALVLELTAVRARALRLEVALNPDIALALCLHGMMQRAFRHKLAAGLEVHAHHVIVADDEGLEKSRAHLENILEAEPDVLLNWLLEQSRDALLQMFAIVTASALDLVHAGGDASDQRKQSLADRIAAEVGLDMNTHWQADLDFWSRLPKAYLLQALGSAPVIANAADEDRAKRLKVSAKLKRDDLAQAVARALDGTAWLPELLVTPEKRGAFELTDTASTMIAAE
jgi:ParB family chromosome partitioning protein